jgi:hypothetical protein
MSVATGLGNRLLHALKHGARKAAVLNDHDGHVTLAGEDLSRHLRQGIGGESKNTRS